MMIDLSVSRSFFAAIRRKFGMNAGKTPSHIQERKQRLLEVIATVGGPAHKFSFQVERTATTSNLDLIEADLFTVLARDRGEAYASHVLAGRTQAQLSSFATLSDK